VHTNKKARQVVGGQQFHFRNSLDSRRSPEMQMVVVMGEMHEESV